MQEVGWQKDYARALHERIRREFPEVRFRHPMQDPTLSSNYLTARVAPDIQILGKTSG